MNTHNQDQSGQSDECNNSPQSWVELPGDERDVLIARVIDGEATNDDWSLFRQVASQDPSIWCELAESQEINKQLSTVVEHEMCIADSVQLPGGMIDDRPMRARIDMISRWGGWAAAAAILLVWFIGNPALQTNSSRHDSQGNQTHDSMNQAGIPGQGLLLNQAQPSEALDQYLNAGQQTGQVIGEMPEQIVIETRPMPDGTIEVLYLRQIIERQIINHAYRESKDEWGNRQAVPVKITPKRRTSF